MQRPTILVLAENAITRRTIRVSAESHGFDVFEAAGVDQAVERAGKGDVAVALLEIGAPSRSDYQTSSRLRSALPAASPIVLIAPPLSRQDQALARACGISELIPKPLEPSRLSELLRRRGGGRGSMSSRFLRTEEGTVSSMTMARPAPAPEGSDAEDPAAVIAEASLTLPPGAFDLLAPDASGKLVRERLEESAKVTADLTRRVALHEAGLSILAGLAESLDETATVDAVLDRLVRQGLDAAGISKGAAYLREADGTLALRSQVGFKSASVAQLVSFFGRADLLTLAMKEGIVLRIPADDTALPEERKWLETAGSRSVAVAPFGRPDRVAGVLVMASRSLTFGEDWLAFARGCASLIGQALELTRAMERRETAARRQSAIADLGRRAIARSTLDEVLSDAAALVESALEIDLAAVFAPETDAPEGALLLRAGAGWGADATRRLSEAAGAGSLAGLCLSSAEPVISHDIGAETRFAPLGAALVRGASSAAAVPIPGGRRGFGALTAYARRKGAFGKDETTFLEGIASVIASAVERDAVQAALRDSDDRLRQSQKMDAIGRLAGGIAHDFNNLLTGITGYCDLLLLTVKPDDSAYADVGEIRKAAQRASALTRQLLAFSRKQPVAPRLLDLNQLISSLEKMLVRLIGEDMDLDVRLADGLGTVSADQSQIEQVIVNLCVNARDAMPKGGRLVVETSNVELDEETARRHVGVEPGRYVLVAVSDTGCGMNKETLSRLFEPFFTTKEQGKGTGLGLSTVYGIVKQSGGGVLVFSEPDAGTTFKVYLPRNDMPAIAEESESAAAPRSGTETILLAEDDDLVRDLTGRILRRAGYTVLEASRGMQALDLGRREADRIDLLVTDVIMPEMSGRDLARRLREGKPALKVLYTSGYTSQHISGHIDDRPGLQFLSKPFSANGLLEAVRKALESEAVGV